MMKIKTFLIAFVLLLAAVAGGIAALPAGDASAFSGGGNGTVADPYLITNVTQLQEMNDEPWAHYRLANNITATATATWNDGEGFEPIGTSSTPFTGSLDGDGRTIIGLTINRPDDDNIGLFGYVGTGGAVTDVGLNNVNITGRNNVGALVGQNRGTVSGSFSAGTSGTVKGINRVGGLVGSNYTGGSVTDSYATRKVEGNDAVGGLAGENYWGTITNSYATGNVDGVNTVGGLAGRNYQGTVTESRASGIVSGISDVGGLIGWNDLNGTVTRSYAIGAVSASSNAGGLFGLNYGSVSLSYATGAVKGTQDCVGGLVGRNYTGGSVIDSYAKGDVEGSNAVGGLAGENWGTVSGSYAAGDVEGTYDHTGGLVGHNYNYGSVTNSYAMGDVNGNAFVGGLVGGNNGGAVTNSFAAGSVEGDSYVGGLVGRNYNEGTVSYSFYDRQTTGQSDTGRGVPRTTAEMKTIGTFTGSYWSIEEDLTNLNIGYPYLSWQLTGTSGFPVWHIYSPLCPPPDVPGVPYPANSDTNAPVNVVLDWADSADADYYDIYFGTDHPQYHGRSYASSYSLSQISPTTTYYWRVVAVNDCGSTWGPAWSFTTCSFPAKPQTPSPGNNATITSTSVLLSWSAAVNASLYDVYFGTSATPPYHGNTSSINYQLPLLNYDTKYYWRVVARNNCGSNPGDVWNFTTVDASVQLDADIMGTLASWALDEDGKLLSAVNVSSPDGDIRIIMSLGAVIKDGSGQPLDEMSVTAVDPLPASPLEGGHVLAAFDFLPDGATFNPGIQIIITYDPDDIPDGIDESDLFIGIYDDDEWQYLSGTLDADSNTITFTVTHFTVFALLALPDGIPPTPTPVPTPAPTPTPTSTPIDELPVDDEDETPMWVWMILGLNVILALAILAAIVFILYRRRQGTRNVEEEETEALSGEEGEESGGKKRGFSLFKSGSFSKLGQMFKRKKEQEEEQE